MRYRSFNEELLIATALLINVFNDIIIDRRKHGLKRDFSKAISLKEVAQQKIEIPCILGDRSSILRSLENEQGKYKLPLIILSNKSIKTDTLRMVDLHSDVFYQQDSQFNELDPENPLYKPQQLGKRRAQPIVMDFDMTIITKYKEDLDQIISNWAVFFRPDIYVKWWSPRRPNETINSEILWNQNIGFELPIEYNPTNVFSYKGTTSFSFKTWLFPGMYSVENKIDPDSEAIIKKFKFYPNRGSWYDDEDLEAGEKDSNDNDGAWYFGEVEVNDDSQSNNENSETQNGENNIYDAIDESDEYDKEDLYKLKPYDVKDLGQMGFWGVSTGQEFYNSGDDVEGLTGGLYAVNNVFAHNYPAISGDPVLSKMKYNTLVGDIFSNYDKHLIMKWNDYQNFLSMDMIQDGEGNAFLKNVYFKGGFAEDDIMAAPPSGDFLYKHFSKTYIKNKNTSSERLVSAKFGDSFIDKMSMHLDYNIDSKNLTLSATFNDNNIDVKMLSVSNSEKGIHQQFYMDSITKTKSKMIRFNFEREIDKNFDIVSSKSKTQTKNVILYNSLIPGKEIEFEMEAPEFKDRSLKILNILNAHKKSLELNELNDNVYEMAFNNSKIGAILRSKGLLELPFRQLVLVSQSFVNGNYYQILMNRYVYMILKLSGTSFDNADIYDFGIHAPLKFNIYHAPVFEISIPESKMLLGFAIDMEF